MDRVGRFTPAGTVLVGGVAPGTNRITAIAPDGSTATTLVESTTLLNNPSDLAIHGSGDLLIANFGTNSIARLTSGGQLTTFYQDADTAIGFTSIATSEGGTANAHVFATTSDGRLVEVDGNGNLQNADIWVGTEVPRTVGWDDTSGLDFGTEVIVGTVSGKVYGLNRIFNQLNLITDSRAIVTGIVVDPTASLLYAVNNLGTIRRATPLP